MNLEIRNKTQVFLLGRAPMAYPIGFQVVGDEQIPISIPVGTALVPDSLVRFDELSRSKLSSSEAIHFYTSDEKFQRVLYSPELYLEKFSKFRAVLTPDCSVTSEMPYSTRVLQTRLSRQIGAVWASHGLNVITSVRWSDEVDFKIALTGIPRCSVIAVGAYGMTRNLESKRILEKGLKQLVELLEPAAMLIFGTIDPELLDWLGNKTSVRVYRPEHWKRRNEEKVSGNTLDLFN
jgi:hypothetical protein